MKITHFFLISFLLLTPSFIQAQVKPLPNGSCTLLGIRCPAVNQGNASQTISTEITRIINVVLSFVAIIAVIIIIYAGIKYIIARGDEKEVEEAKNIILYTIIGLIIIGLSAALVNFVTSVLR